MNQKSRALRYALHGWAVLPLRSIKNGCCTCAEWSKCKRPGKHPLTKHGVQDATTDPKQIKAWWTKWPQANIGIATGKVSGIIVIDIDPQNGGSETLKQRKAELGPLGETVKARSGGGGTHRIYKYPAFDVKTDTSGKVLGRGIDLLSDGSYIVAPMSIHASGKNYVWFTGYGDRDREPIEPSQPWLNHLQVHGMTKPKLGEGGHDTKIVNEGQRNSHLTSLAGTLRNTGMSEEATLAALLAENDKKCAPPLDRSEVEKIVKSIARYHVVQLLKPDADLAEQVMQIVLDENFAGGEHLMYYIDGQFWNYDGRKWIPIRPASLQGRVLTTLQKIPHKQSSTSIISQVLSLLQARLVNEQDCLRFDGDPLPVINCINGELWIVDDGEVDLRPHNPKSYLRHCLDVSYDPAAKCPLYDKTVHEIFAKAPDTDKMVRHWHDFVGHVISQRRTIPIIAIGLGRGNNSKTKLMETAGRLLGPDLVHHVKIESLDTSRFAIGSLLGKALLIDDDVSAGIKLPDGLLKKISEGKTLTGERKHGSTFNFRNRIVPVLLCNGIPSLADLSVGMLKRLMVIPFDRTFTPEEDDRDRFKKIWADEMPGVLNRALAGLKRVIQSGNCFKFPESVTKATTGFLRQANPLPAFIKERCDHSPAARCLMRDLYKKYCDWARENGITLTQQQSTVRRNLDHLGYPVKHGNRGGTVHGLRLKNALESD
jgi:putative DNA primase/helicase